VKAQVLGWVLDVKELESGQWHVVGVGGILDVTSVSEGGAWLR